MNFSFMTTIIILGFINDNDDELEFIIPHVYIFFSCLMQLMIVHYFLASSKNFPNKIVFLN